MIRKIVLYFLSINILFLLVGCSHTSQVKINTSEDIFSEVKVLDLLILSKKKAKSISKKFINESYKNNLFHEMNLKLAKYKELIDSLSSVYNNLVSLKKRFVDEQSKEYLKYIKTDFKAVTTNENYTILKSKISNIGILTVLIENIGYEYKSRLLQVSKIDLLLSPGKFVVIEDTLSTTTDASNIYVRPISIRVIDSPRLKKIEKELKDIEVTLAELKLKYKSMNTENKSIIDKYYTIPLIKIMEQSFNNMKVNSIKLYHTSDTTITCPTGSVLFFFAYNKEKCYQWTYPVNSKVKTINITKDNTYPLIK